MKHRIVYIDLLRTIGITLMVLAHIPLPSSFVHLVHGFHMPLFFVISGYLYRGGGRPLKIFLEQGKNYLRRTYYFL